MKIKRYKHGEGDFWNLMGPFFASAAVRRELEIAMSSDENYIWFLALDGGAVIGFAALEMNGEVAILRHAYVVPERRANGIYVKILAARLDYAKTRASLLKVTADPEMTETLKAQGFEVVSHRGKFSMLELRV